MGMSGCVRRSGRVCDRECVNRACVREGVLLCVSPHLMAE